VRRGHGVAPSHFIPINRTLAKSRASVNPSPASELILPGLWRRPGSPSRKRQLDLASGVGRLRRENDRLRMGRDNKSRANVRDRPPDEALYLH
jgi:hypothetical protein